MTLNKTESLRLYSNNDISSQSQVNIMPKRKRDRISDPAKNMQSLPTCIIRVTSLSDHGRFTALSQFSDTLQHNICEIRDIRFRQSIDSSYRMQSVASRSQQLSSLIWKIQGIIASVICVILAIKFVSKMVQNCYHQHHDGVTQPLNRLQLVRI